MASKKKKSCAADILCRFLRIVVKCRIAQKIAAFFPEHDLYIEPFIGRLKNNYLIIYGKEYFF